jgi:hypothetical protein
MRHMLKERGQIFFFQLKTAILAGSKTIKTKTKEEIASRILEDTFRIVLIGETHRTVENLVKHCPIAVSKSI